jgi:hypothetical protein
MGIESFQNTMIAVLPAAPPNRQAIGGKERTASQLGNTDKSAIVLRGPMPRCNRC